MARKEKEGRKEPNSLPQGEESCFLNEYVFYPLRLVIEAFVAFSSFDGILNTICYLLTKT